jgi:LL-diaminopimelate aminotransferase
MGFDGVKPPSILEAKNAMDIAIECHSLSKPYSMTGWRIGFAVGNVDAVDILAKVKSTTDTGIFKAIQKAGAKALTDPSCDDYIKENNLVLERRQKFMVEGFKKLGWPIDESIVPKATFYLWLPIPDRYKTAEEFTNDLLSTSGIVAVPGNGFGVCADRYFRLSLVLPDESLMEVLTRMQQDGFTFK